MPRHELGGGGAWLARWWRALLSEACATALLVWLGVAASLPVGGATAMPLAHVAQAFGCVVVGCAVGFGPASGAHMNPAVTLAALVSGRLRTLPAVAYAVAQTVGAVVGFLALQGTLPMSRGAGVTRPASDVGPVAAAALEAALTGLLALACCAAWAAPEPDPAVPLKLGLLVAGLVYAGGPASGASLNPARSFAPALLHNDWEHQWVYWAGPLGGAALAALLHRFVLTTERKTRKTRTEHGDGGPEAVPLDDKP